MDRHPFEDLLEPGALFRVPTYDPTFADWLLAQSGGIGTMFACALVSWAFCSWVMK